MFGNRVAREIQELFASSGDISHNVFSYDQITELPPPVQGYLRYSLNEGQRYISCGRMKQDGLIRAREGQRWQRLTAEQYFTTEEPGFIWHARTRLLRFLWITARDRYYRGQGNMLIKFLSTFTMGDVKGKEMDEASLIRFVAEMPAYPTALLSARYLSWEPVDINSARAIARHEGHEVSMVFHFNEVGQVTSVTTPDRCRQVRGGLVKTHWTGHIGDYQEINGMRIPREMEAVWNLPKGDFSYGRFTVTEIEYNNPTKY